MKLAFSGAIQIKQKHAVDTQCIRFTDKMPHSTTQMEITNILVTAAHSVL